MAHRSGIADDALSRPWLLLLFLSAFGALLAPPLLTPTPPVLDYPNHYARLWMIAGGIREGYLSQFYAVDWSRAATNIGGDLLAALFGRIVGPERVAPALLTLSIVAPPLGGLLLHRRVFGGTHWWQLTFAFAGWGMVSLVGFMNFEIGLGVALGAAALDGAIARRPRMAPFARAALAVVTLAFHPFAAMFYVGLVAALALGPDLRLRWPPVRSSRLPAIAGTIAATTLPLLAILIAAPAPVLAGQGPMLEWAPFTIAKKVSILSTGFRSYSPAADLLVALALVGLPAWALARRRLSVHGGLLGLGLAALSIIMPTRIGEAYWTDRRLPVMALLTFLAAVRPDILVSRSAALITAAALAALTGVRTAYVGLAWLGGQRDVAAVHRALAHVPPGCMIVSVAHIPSEAETHRAPAGRYFGSAVNFWSYPAMAVPWRRAFVPNLFTQAGQQPLRVLPPWSAYSTPVAPPPSIAALYGTTSPRIDYMRRWRSFDYLLVLNADMHDTSGASLPREELQLVSDEGFAALYRIAPLRAASQPNRPSDIACGETL